MTRKRLAIYVFLDLLFLGAVGYRLWTVYQRIEAQEAAAAPVVPMVADIPSNPETETITPPETSTTTAEIATPEVPATSTTTLAVPAAEPAAAPVTSTATATPVVEPSTRPAAPRPRPAPPAGPKQAVRFTYFNGKATSVFITGSFNKWTPQPFRKTANESWSVVLQIAPGDYSYNFVVDGKTIRDPNQRRSDDQGRSLLTVAPPKP